MWKFEHLRRFTLELNFLVVALSSRCNATTCRVMKATDEWQYLCAAHKTPKEVPFRPLPLAWPTLTPAGASAARSITWCTRSMARRAC